MTIKDLFNVQYLKARADESENLTPLQIKILYKRGDTSMFFNPNIEIPCEILIKFVRNHYFLATERDFFFRKDVQKNLSEIMNVYIESFVPKWIDFFFYKNSQLASERNIPERACTALVKELEMLQSYGVKISEENLYKLTQFKSKIDFFQEGITAYENIVNNM